MAKFNSPTVSDEAYEANAKEHISSFSFLQTLPLLKASTWGYGIKSPPAPIIFLLLNSETVAHI